MSALDILRRWLSPILDPFSEMPTHLNAMQQNHLDSLNNLEYLMTGLVMAPPDQQFSGPAAEEAIQFVEDFLKAERALSSAGSILEEATTATTTCVEEVEIATETLAVAAEDESVLLEVTAAVDVASVAQAGLDPVTDIPGIILTVIAGTFIIGALVSFGWSVYSAVQAWISAMNRASSQSYPNPPQMHKGPVNSLTADQEKMARRLFEDFGHLGLSLDDIRAIIANNPNLTEAQLRALLSRYASVVKNNPNLVSKYGALAVFQSFIALAAYDPAHGGNYSIRKPSTEDMIFQGMDESEAELGVMEQGKAPWPFTPSLETAYEAIDENGQKWDVKGYLSVDSNGRAFDPENTLGKMQKDFQKGENIILDTRNLTPEEAQGLYEKLKENGQDDRVIWWPYDPNS